MRSLAQIAMLLVAVCAAIMALFANAGGVGLSPDSVAYIGAAHGVLRGVGLGMPLADGRYSPMVFYAPLFSLLLAAIGWTGIDPLDGARWLNALFFAATVLLAGRIIERDTRSLAAGLIGALLLAIAQPMLLVHSMAWSEPTFVFLSLVALSGLSRFRQCGGRRFLVTAAVASGLAVLSRYVGIALIAAGVVAILDRQRPDRSGAHRECGVFVGVSGLLAGSALVRNWIVAGTLSDRPVWLHLIDLARLRRGVETLAGWVQLGPRALLLAALATGAAALLLFGGARRRRPPSDESPAAAPSGAVDVTLLFGGSYALVLLVAGSLSDAATPLDERILAPLVPWAVIGGVCAGQRAISDVRRSAWMKTLVMGAGMWFAVAQLAHAVPWLLEVHRNGQGYASPAWRDSELLARVRALPAETAIFSNGDDAIYVLTGRTAERLPERFSAVTTATNDAYQAELARLRERLSASPGVVVYFSRIDWRPNLVSAAEIEQAMGMRPSYAAADGTIYTVHE